MNQQHGLVKMPQSNHPFLRQTRPLPDLPNQINDPENLGERRRIQHYQHPNCCLGSLLVFSIALATLAAIFMGSTPQPSTPLQALQSRSLLDNHDMYHLQAHAKALRAPLNNFHMEENMPLYRLYISSLQQRNENVLHGIENVTLCVEELAEISAQEITSQTNLVDKFERKIRECGQDVEIVRSMAKHGIGAYEQIIAFIGHELNDLMTIADHTKIYFPSAIKAQPKETEMSRGWRPFLQQSRAQWATDKILLLNTVSRLSRFGIALQAMRPKRVEGLTPELVWEEVNDRAALCRSLGVAQGNVTAGSRWVLAAGSDSGEVYLNWYNGVGVK